MSLPGVRGRHIGSGLLVALLTIAIKYALGSLATSGLATRAGPTSIAPQQRCAQNVHNVAPIVPAAMADRSVSLCTDAAAILYSLKSCDPVWSAERLTPERIAAARRLDRVNSFHDDDAIEPRCRTFHAYTRSGWDRGHMSPNGDMPDRRAQYDSFSMANIVPQNPDNNRRLWAHIENSVRDYVESGHVLYVVTGPLFIGQTTGSLNQVVAIPTRLFKAVYDSDAGSAGVFIADNAPGSRYGAMSLDNFAARYSLVPFPDAPAETRRTLSIPGVADRAARFDPALGQSDKDADYAE